MLDITANLLGLEILPEETHLVLAPVIGLSLPVSPQQAMQFPFAIIRFGMSKDAAIEKAKELLAAAEALPDPPKQSDIIVPGGPVDVDAIAQSLQGQFK